MSAFANATLSDIISSVSTNTTTVPTLFNCTSVAVIATIFVGIGIAQQYNSIRRENDLMTMVQGMGTRHDRPVDVMENMLVGGEEEEDDHQQQEREAN
jgi:hypothetical protein